MGRVNWQKAVLEVRKTVTVWFADLVKMLFPPVCEVCGCRLMKGEKVLCLDCLTKLPRVNVHLNPEHELAKRLAASSKVYRLASMFSYVRDTDYARVIQRSKYNNRPDIDHDLAVEFASELLNSGFFSGIDLILPVPMHPWKKIRRGYNQADEIAAGVSAVTGIPIADNLIARRRHGTQTRRNAMQRMQNAQGIYDVVYPQELAGKHVLIVDDVITTGATVMACSDAIRCTSPTTTVSVLTLAATHFLQ